MRAPLLPLLLLCTPAAAAPRLAARIDAVMARWNKADGPGCSVGVIQNGKPLFEKGYGMADLEHAVPNGPDTVFDIGSTSKQFTAAAVLMLAAEGRLSLDDDVRKHLPELPELAPITLRQLLHHTSGIRDYTGLLVLQGFQVADVTTSQDALAALARQKGLDFAPGERFEYSNSGFFLLAQVVERVTHKTFADHARVTFFEPLGMTHTHVHDDTTFIVRDRAIGYAPRLLGWKIAMSGWEQTGDGAVMTTIRDLARWDANFYDPKVGGTKLIEGMLERGTTSDGKTLEYASGLFVRSYRGLPTVEHGGAWAGYRAQLLRFPAQRTSVIVLCNATNSGPGQLAEAIADVVLEKELAPVPAPVLEKGPGIAVGAAELDRWVGTYRETTRDDIVDVRRDGEKLVTTARGREVALVPRGGAAFGMAGFPAKVTVTFAGAAPARRATMVDPTHTERYEEVVRATPSAADLTACAGRYHSDELAADWTLTVDAGVLIARGRNVTAPFAPLAKDTYIAEELGAIVTFTRDGKGAVDGFLLGSGKPRGLRFERVR